MVLTWPADWNVSSEVPTGRSVVFHVALLDQTASNFDSADSMPAPTIAGSRRSTRMASLAPLKRALEGGARLPSWSITGLVMPVPPPEMMATGFCWLPVLPCSRAMEIASAKDIYRGGRSGSLVVAGRG